MTPRFAFETDAKVILVVRHRTTLAYDGPIVEGHTEIRKLPSDTGLQRVITSRLEVTPPTRVRERRDYFGNRVSQFDVLDPHETLDVLAESVVETTDAVCCGPEAEPDPRPWDQRFAEFLAWSPAVPELAEYAEIGHGVARDLGPDAFLAALHELAGAIHARFRYDTDVTDVYSSPAEVFVHGGGVCQDFAHVMIGVLRRAGLAARYASGYLYDPAADDPSRQLRGAAASHAWVQAFHPELGWVGIDPTNHKLADWRYARTAIGRDYCDVQPLRGVFRGGARQSLSVAVDVSRLSPMPIG